LLSALSVTFGDSSPKGGATGVPVRPHSLRGVLFYQKQKCSAVQIHDILTSIIVQKPLFLTTAHCILRHICFQQSAQSFPACQSLSPWERWHCEAMTERAGPVRQSRRTAISRPFVSAMLSPCLRIFVSILALSVTFGDSSPKGRAFRAAFTASLPALSAPASRCRCACAACRSGCAPPPRRRWRRRGAGRAQWPSHPAHGRRW